MHAGPHCSLSTIHAQSGYPICLGCYQIEHAGPSHCSLSTIHAQSDYPDLLGMLPD